MNKPEVIPEAVKNALVRWSKNHNQDVPEVEWDAMMACYYFVANGMYHGVELDGHIHT